MKLLILSHYRVRVLFIPT